eukprot:CFRG6728T1
MPSIKFHSDWVGSAELFREETYSKWFFNAVTKPSRAKEPRRRTARRLGSDELIGNCDAVDLCQLTAVCTESSASASASASQSVSPATSTSASGSGSGSLWVTPTASVTSSITPTTSASVAQSVSQNLKP